MSYKTYKYFDKDKNPLDMLGNPIFIGDTIAHAAIDGRSPKMQTGIVQKFTFKKNTYDHRQIRSFIGYDGNNHPLYGLFIGPQMFPVGKPVKCKQEEADIFTIGYKKIDSRFGPYSWTDKERIITVQIPQNVIKIAGVSVTNTTRTAKPLTLKPSAT